MYIFVRALTNKAQYSKKREKEGGNWKQPNKQIGKAQAIVEEFTSEIMQIQIMQARLAGERPAN